MGEVSTIGLDIAKGVFQVHGIDGAGAVGIRKRISRSKVLEFFAELRPCLVGIEACPSAHHWGRELQKLGHTVKLMPPSYVKAYLKRGKNDANDAAAICEAVTRPWSPAFGTSPGALWRALGSAGAAGLFEGRGLPVLAAK
jgi:transposase